MQINLTSIEGYTTTKYEEVSMSTKRVIVNISAGNLSNISEAET